VKIARALRTANNLTDHQNTPDASTNSKITTEATMLSRLSRVARSLTTTVRTPNTVIRPAVARFSTEQLVLGKGRGKTSTGLVSEKC
jgi:hypothetical protein